MKGIMSYIFGPNNSEDIHYDAPDNVTLPMFVTSGEIYEDSSYDDDEVYENSTEDSNNMRETDHIYRTADKESRRRIDHVVKSIRDRFMEPHTMISHVYRSFVEAYPFAETINPDALEYVRPNESYERRTIKHGHFKCLFYSELVLIQDTHPRSYIVMPDTPNVFLVSLQHDYVYSRVIESALLRHDPSMLERSENLFERRKRVTKPCVADHQLDEKCCPSEWILYVDQTSEFYKYCTLQLRDRNPLVNHTLTAGYINPERLSFYQVLFLCGDQMKSVESYDNISLENNTIRSAYYDNINQWKRLPIWFLDIWYSGHPNQL